MLERDADVVNWLHPHPKEFDITYNRGRNYEPDFVVETEDKIYLVEVKGEDKLTLPDVLAKKERAVHYCKVVCDWAKENGYKPWQYLFIPSTKIKGNSTFLKLAEEFKEL